MQDVQNIPNPDVNSTEDELNNHSDFPSTDTEPANDIPTAPDHSQNVPIEEPPETKKPAIDEDTPEADKIV